MSGQGVLQQRRPLPLPTEHRPDAQHEAGWGHHRVLVDSLCRVTTWQGGTLVSLVVCSADVYNRSADTSQLKGSTK